MNAPRTHVLRLVAPIGDHRPSISMDEIRHAITPRVPVDDGLLISLDQPDGTGDLFQHGAEAITRRARGYLEHRVGTSDTDHLSIFAFAPMPLVMLFGRIVGDKQAAEVYERHRHTDSWRWDDDAPPLEWSLNFPPRPVPSHDVALLLSISASVPPTMIAQALDRPFDVVEITVPKPETNLVRTRPQLRQFAEMWRLALNRIKDAYGTTPRVHLFPVAPLSVCVECGRRLLPKADPELRVYDRFGGAYRYALSLHGPAEAGLDPHQAISARLGSSIPVQNWRQALHRFFVSAFAPDELLRLLEGLEPGIRAFLPIPPVSKQDFAGAVLERIDERGLIAPCLFTALADHFTSAQRKSEVEAIRLAWTQTRAANQG